MCKCGVDLCEVHILVVLGWRVRLVAEGRLSLWTLVLIVVGLRVLVVLLVLGVCMSMFLLAQDLQLQEELLLLQEAGVG